jgi:hypothetical protein
MQRPRRWWILLLGACRGLALFGLLASCFSHIYVLFFGSALQFLQSVLFSALLFGVFVVWLPSTLCILWLQKACGKESFASLLWNRPGWARKVYFVSAWYVGITMILIVALFLLVTFVPGFNGATNLIINLVVGVVTYFLIAAFAMTLVVFSTTLFEIKNLTMGSHGGDCSQDAST